MSYFTAADESRARILIVDDTEANRYALRRFVERAGHTVIEATTGNDGFNLAAQEHPDLIILDVNLPDIDGFATCRRIKANSRLADIPVIQVSASFVGASEQVKGLEGGADAYLTQPVEPTVLLATVNAVLRAHRSERELRQLQLQLRAALEAAEMESFRIDWPKQQIWRYAASEVETSNRLPYAHPLEDFLNGVHADDRAMLRERIGAAIASQHRYEAEYRVQTAAGMRWRLERGNVVADSAGEVLELVGVSVDVTERKQLEEALIQADTRKDEFLAMLGHELRNPLAPIRNAARALDMLTTESPAMKAMLAVIHRQVTQMTRLVDDLLDVSRITRGKVELKISIVSLASVIDHSIETVRPLLESRKHELVTSPVPPLFVSGDLARLAQAISNVLSNAAKYTEPGGRIEMQVSAEGDEAVISIKDNGIGIPAALLPNVFDMFMQGDRTLDRSQGGLGIGLALVKSLVQFHNGSVSAFSQGVGHGSEFIIRLPLVGEETRGVESAERADANVERRKVLIVDDNRDAAESMAALLRIKHHNVRIAHSGPAAIQLAASFVPEVIFLDIGLPEMSGLEVVRHLRAVPDVARALIVAITGYGQPSDAQRSLAAGFDRHLVKPLDPTEFDSVLRHL